MKKKLVLIIFSLLCIISCKKQEIIIEEKPVTDSILTTTKAFQTVHVNVTNLGFPGYRTIDLTTVADLVKNKNKDLIIIMCGTNDIAFHQSADYRINLFKLIEDIGDTNAQIMLLSPPPTAKASDEADFESLSKLIHDISLERDYYFVDVFSLFENAGNVSDELLLPDGIHPTAKGYQLIAKKIYDYMAADGIKKQDIICFGDSITYGYLLDGAGTITGNSYPAQLSRLLNHLL